MHATASLFSPPVLLYPLYNLFFPLNRIVDSQKVTGGMVGEPEGMKCNKSCRPGSNRGIGFMAFVSDLWPNTKQVHIFAMLFKPFVWRRK